MRYYDYRSKMEAEPIILAKVFGSQTQGSSDRGRSVSTSDAPSACRTARSTQERAIIQSRSDFFRPERERFFPLPVCSCVPHEMIAACV